MRVVLDAHLSPAVARWLNDYDPEIESCSLRSLDMLTHSDAAIYQALREPGTVLVSKDDDFKRMVMRLGPPPQVLLLSFGNTSNEHLRQVLAKRWPEVKKLLRAGAPLIEIR